MPSLFRASLPLIALSLVACSKPGPAQAGPPGPSAAPASAPSSSVVSAAQTGECPLELRPGVSLGPIRIGESRAEVEQHGLSVKSTSKHDSVEFLEVGTFHVELCGGKVVDVWLDDLRKAPDCVAFGGRKIDRTISREQLIALFSDCRDAPPRTGGEFKECEQSGVRIGWGMGDFIQLRVAKKGTRLDDTCEMLLDDGKPVPLSTEAKAKMFQKLLDLDLLAPFWHPEQPGRDPLKLVENQVVAGQPELTIFGSKVVYVDKAEAQRQKLPFFEITRLTSSATKARIEFQFPVEGVVGHVEFEKRFDDWQLTGKEVAER